MLDLYRFVVSVVINNRDFLGELWAIFVIELLPWAATSTLYSANGLQYTYCVWTYSGLEHISHEVGLVPLQNTQSEYIYIYTPFTRDGLLPMILGEVLANSMGKSNILREVSGQLYSQRSLFQWPSWHATKWQKPKKHQCFSKIRQKDGVSSLAEIALARKAHSG